MNEVARFCRVAAVLLAYPDALTRELAVLVPKEVEACETLASEDRLALIQVSVELAQGDALAAQSRYVELFDRTRSVSLHLFEHVHGDGRERGQAMVELSARYAAAGFVHDGRELPDYLPALCELAAVAPQLGVGLLRDAAPLLARIAERLHEMNSPYSVVFRALCALLGLSVETSPVADAAELRPPTAEALDAEWAEEPVTFGVMGAMDGAQSQRAAGARIRLRRSSDGAVIS